MNPQSRYVVIYKDSPSTRNKYFGPFMSLTLAEHFMQALPEPLEGGSKTFKSLQPYTYDERTLAHDVLLRQRERGDLLDTIFDIVAAA